MDHVEVLADQLAREVGIDMIGIEQRYAVLQLVALGRERGDLGLALFEQRDGSRPMRAPRSGPCQRQPAEQQQHAEAPPTWVSLSRGTECWQRLCSRQSAEITDKVRIQAIFAAITDPLRHAGA